MVLICTQEKFLSKCLAIGFTDRPLNLHVLNAFKTLFWKIPLGSSFVFNALYCHYVKLKAVKINKVYVIDLQYSTNDVSYNNVHCTCYYSDHKCFLAVQEKIITKLSSNYLFYAFLYLNLYLSTWNLLYTHATADRKTSQNTNMQTEDIHSGQIPQTPAKGRICLPVLANSTAQQQQIHKLKPVMMGSWHPSRNTFQISGLTWAVTGC